jgi:hypothetical protein
MKGALPPSSSDSFFTVPAHCHQQRQVILVGHDEFEPAPQQAAAGLGGQLLEFIVRDGQL